MFQSSSHFVKFSGSVSHSESGLTRIINTDPDLYSQRDPYAYFT
ncbi:hypothetical protein [Rothia endophytica]|nr:hypothetical protein [Rothia endophytica]